MKMNEFDPISKVLDTATPVGKLERPQLPAPDDEIKEAPEIDEDFQEARANMKELISQAMEQIPELINLMEQSQNDKMISAVSSFIKTTADLNTSLSKLTKDIKRLPKTHKNIQQDASDPSTIPTNTVFIGTTEQLLRMLNNRNDASQAIDGEFVEVERN